MGLICSEVVPCWTQHARLCLHLGASIGAEGGGVAHVRILHLHGRVERLIANLLAGLARARQVGRLRLLLVAQRWAHALAHRMRVLRRLLRLIDLLSVCGAVVRPAAVCRPSAPPSDPPAYSSVNQLPGFTIGHNTRCALHQL